jgi:acyl-CoA thioesterase-1
LQQADRIEPGGAIVLVEIGGNDLLGTTTASDYEKGLAFLLGALSRPEREVVMFELPLLPFKNQFGRIQRRLASAHGVKLIPKRALISVLTSNSSTLDSIHLSPRGHAEMAALVWPILKPACESAP